MFILDTDHVSALMRGDAAVISRVTALGNEPLAMSVVTLAELLHGARYRGSAKIEGVIWQLASNAHVLQVDTPTADRYASIRSRLWKIGKPLPENDYWIAAAAAAHAATLATGDAHFAEVVEIKTENWIRPQGSR